MQIEIKLYVHGSRESAYEVGEKAGLRDEALRMFMFAAGEHEMTYSVDTENGTASLIAVDGFVLSEQRHPES